MHRRRFLASSAAILSSAALPLSSVHAQRCERTEDNIEGPFFRPGAPHRTDLRAEGIRVAGTVRSAAHCGPAQGSVMEVWQANEAGEYDLQTFNNRGVVFCDDQGRFDFATVRPGHYDVGGSYRPAHIHVKVHVEGRPSLTTQLYFPNDPHQASDPWFRPSLLLRSEPHSPEHFLFDFTI